MSCPNVKFPLCRNIVTSEFASSYQFRYHIITQNTHLLQLFVMVLLDQQVLISSCNFGL